MQYSSMHISYKCVTTCTVHTLYYLGPKVYVQLITLFYTHTHKKKTLMRFSVSFLGTKVRLVME